MEDSNAMPSTSMAAARGRGRGRPPKREHAQPPDAELQNYQEESPGGDSPNTIRRSSRKRFCKFDVRDVLSLRKPEHKIQIEGRIDSNVPDPAPAVAPAGAPSTAASATTSPSIPSANRLFSMFPSNRPPPKLPPPPAALGIFVKPRSTPSLIVAQLNSESSSCNTSTATAPAPATAAAAFAASVMRRGRGRPRTKSSLDKTHSQSSSHSMNFSDSDTNSTGASTTGSIGSRGSTDSNEATAPRRKCRVTLKRLNFVQRQGSWDSGDSTVLGDAVVDVSSSSSSAASTPVLQDENALDEQPKMKPLLLPLPVSLPTVVDDDGDSSDSQIIFTEIDTGREVTGLSRVEQSEEPPQQLQLPLKTDPVIEIEVEIEQQEQEPDVCNVLTDNSSGSPGFWLEDGEEEDASQTPSSARRRSRRTAKTEGANSSSSSQAGKTLEETFAEIAAASSKQILLKAESDSHSEGDNDEEEEEEHTLIDLIEDDSHDEGIHGEYELVLDEPMTDEGQVQVIELDGALAAAEDEQQQEPQVSTEVTLQLQEKSPRCSDQPQTIILEVEAEEEEKASTEQQTPVVVVADVPAEPKPEPEAVLEDVVIIQIALPEPEPEISLEMEATQMTLPLPQQDEDEDEKEVVPILVPMEIEIPIESMTEPTKAAFTGEHSPAAEPKQNEKGTPSKPEQSAEEPKSHSNASLSLSPTAMAVATSLATPSAAQGKAIVECDAMFQALESANAQKLREETHKKKVKLEAKKAATSIASTPMASNTAGAQKQTKRRTTTTTTTALGGRSKTRRNTSYYASNERETTSTPVPEARSQAKKQKPSATKKTEPRADGLLDPAANGSSRKMNTDELEEDFSSSSSSQQEEQCRGSATAKRSKSRGSLASDASKDEAKAHSQSAPKKENAMPTRRFTTIDRPSPKAAPRGTALGDICKDGTKKATSTGGRQSPAVSAATKRRPTLSRGASLESLAQKDAKKDDGKTTAGGKQSPANLIKNIRKSSASGESLDATKKASSRTQSPASMAAIKRRQTTSSECLAASTVEARKDEKTPRPVSPKEKPKAMPSIAAKEPRLSFEQLLGQADTYTKTQKKPRTSTSASGRSSPVSACSTSSCDSAVRAPEAGKAKEKAAPAPAPAEQKASPNAIRSRRFTTIDRTSWSDAPNGPRKTQSKPSTPRELSPNGDPAGNSGSQPKSRSNQPSPAIGAGSKLTKKKINTSRLTLMDHSAADISEKLIKACLNLAASSDEADAGKSQSPAPKQEAKQAAASVSCASRRSSRTGSISASSSSSSKPTSRMSSPAANEPKIKKINARRKTEAPEQSHSGKKVASSSRAASPERIDPPNVGNSIKKTADARVRNASPAELAEKLSSRRGTPATKTGSGSPLLMDQRRRVTICAEPVLAAVALRSADPRVRNASPAELLPIPMPRERTLPKKSANLAAPTPKKPKAPKVAVKRAAEPPDLISKKPRRPTTSSKSTEEALPVQLDAVEPMDTESTESASGKSKRWDVQPSTATEASASAAAATSTATATTPEVQPPDALRDIVKFIEDGVNLLNRSYKHDEDEDEAQPGAVKGDDQLASASCLETPSVTRSPTPSGSSNSRSGASTRANTITEDSSPTLPLMLLPQGSNEDGSAGGVRRSHRIKQKPQGPKASQGRGVASSAPPFSMEDQMAELANTEAINEQFLRSEGLLTFQQLRENYYRCARQVSQENAEMQCDCFLTGDEEAQGHLCCGAGCINRMLMIECGPLCTNGERCTNKRFQLHQCWPCRVFRTEKKGCGITAELLIPAGEFIMEYVGEVIDSEEFERRQHRYSKDRNRHYYFMALRGEAIIDATMRGNISRYINHSCDPNAETQKWTVNGELRIGFFSVKTILPGEEITFDYQYQRYGRDAQRCYCEAANCRGWIGTEPESDEGEQKNENNTQTDDTDSESDAEEAEPEQSKSKAKASAAKNSSKFKVKLPAVSKEQRKKRESAAKAKERDREFKAGRWLKPTTGAGAGAGAGAAEKKDPRGAKPKVNKFHAMLEDPDVLEQLSLLSRSGLKNQLDTLRISRIMVRAKLLPTRIQLLQVLTRGELPCRRLFLDYHGLRLLHAWISENGSEQQLRTALLDALEALPIPNKTMLNESRVYQSVQQWSAGLAGQQPQLRSPEQSALRKRMQGLISKWSSLPEIFRIPKRERIEQMKEHEREADRTGERPTEKHVASHHVTAASALEDSARDSSTDRYRQDRFRRDTISSRNSGGPKPPMSRMSGNNTICTITTQPKGSNPSEGQPRTEMRRRPDNSSGATLETRRGGAGGSGGGGALLSKELRRSLFERKVAQDEAEKRVCSEDWREHELRCEYFGADINTDPKLLPFSYNTETGEWFNSEDVPVMAPLRTDLALAPSPEMSEQDMLPAEYKLPASVDPLPLSWHWSRTIEGYIFYYNLRDRIPQWLPPSPEQRLQTLLEGDPQQQQPLQELDPALLDEELISVDPDYVGSLSSKSLAQHIETKVRERREIRHKKLCSVRVISPRRDEDRLYNQLESRKYKENKEKIRRRKEIYRRQRASADTVAATSSDASNTDAEAWSTPRYLYSSDEEVEAPKSPQLEGIIYGFNGSAGSLFSATKVDELEAELDMEPSTSAYALACLNKPQQIPTLVTGGSGGGITRKLPPLPPHTPEKPPAAVPERKSRSGGHERSKPKRKMLLHSTKSGRESIDKFRFDISGHVADFLRPFRKDNCQMGRITSDADYKFLIKRLTEHVITKEMRYCEMSGHPLICNDSVKHKSHEFINQYMLKKGRVYTMPLDEAAF
ncbi:probable histone-lysine N-methyltransferase [Drosophila madeirensis]|uniref:[histone H3]-lysine(36) N-trimethyltransferase n=1 Tax=Drosophila madeirensis TaxID=30013 RepID=A0AAU9G066_DROMD